MTNNDGDHENVLFQEPTGWMGLEWEKVKDELCVVLVDKTTGSDLDLVLRSNGDGVRALQDLHRWSTRQYTAGLMARTEKSNNPERAKNEYEVYQKVQEWNKEMDEVVRLDMNLKMHDNYKVNAVKKILTGKVRTIVGNRLNWTWDELLATVRDWSLQAGVEHREKSQGAMETNQVTATEGPNGQVGIPNEPGESDSNNRCGVCGVDVTEAMQWGDCWCGAWACRQSREEVDALGKGKSEGKNGVLGKGGVR